MSGSDKFVNLRVNDFKPEAPERTINRAAVPTIIPVIAMAVM